MPAARDRSMALHETVRKASGVRLRQVPLVAAEAKYAHNSGAEPSFNDYNMNWVVSYLNSYYKVITYITIDVK